jgi:rubredoxin
MKRWICRDCGNVYDEALGIPESGIVPGTRFEDLPADWVCPVCGAPKSEFESEFEAQDV